MQQPRIKMKIKSCRMAQGSETMCPFHYWIDGVGYCEKIRGEDGLTLHFLAKPENCDISKEFEIEVDSEEAEILTKIKK